MSYNTLVEAQAFNAAITAANLADATIYLEARYGALWGGKIEDTSQVENWPRVDFCGETLLDVNGREIIGVPDAVKRAELEAAVLIQEGNSLLDTAVATASSVSSTTGGTLIHNEVQAGSVKSIKKWSADSSESSTSASVQELDDNGYPVIKLLDGILYHLITSASFNSGSNFYFTRA